MGTKFRASRGRGGGPLGSPREPRREVFSPKFRAAVQSRLAQLEPTQRDIRPLIGLRDDVERALRDGGIAIDRTRVFGSYTRGTMIRTGEGSDLDTMFVLDPVAHGAWKAGPGGPAAAIAEFKRQLELHPIHDAEVSVKGDVIVVRRGEFSIDVVPAFDGGSRTELIPDRRGGGWKSTAPRIYQRLVQAADERYDGNVSKLAKFAKDWVKTHGGELESFHTESIVLQHFRQTNVAQNAAFEEHLIDFSAHFAEYVRRDTRCPTDDNEILSNYLTPEKRTQAISNAQGLRSWVESLNRGESKGTDPSKAESKLPAE